MSRRSQKRSGWSSRSEPEDFNEVHLFQQTTGDELREWLAVIEGAEASENGVGAILTSWEHGFIRSVRLQVENANACGIDQPLTGKQLVVVRRAYLRLVQVTHSLLSVAG